MKYEAFYRCDLCNQKFATGREVRNDVCLINGTFGRVYGDVCDDCVAKTARLIDEKFPRNKTILTQESATTPALA